MNALSLSKEGAPDRYGFSRPTWPAIAALVIGLKALLFILGGQAFQILNDKKIGSVYDWFHVWHRWDVNAYLRLAEFGYRFSDKEKADMMFYPLYPWTIRYTTYLTGDYFISALVVSAIASVVVAVVFFELVKLEYPEPTSTLALWFFLIFPTAYFLHIAYSESLFLTFAIGSIYAARTNRWMFAGLLGIGACLARANGLILVPALLVEAAHQFSVTRKWEFRWLWILVIPLGFGGYLGVNFYASGDAFAFFEIRRQFFHIVMAPPWQGVRSAFAQAGWASEMVGVQELVFLALGFFCSIISWFKLRPVYSTWITFCWLLAASVSFCQSIPRYTLAMFPIFMLFALAAKRPFWLAVITLWSILYLGLFSSQFVWGRWAF